jgi:hypothetical protein
MNPYPPGVFMHLESERLKCILVRDGRSVQISMRSDLTGERVSLGALVPPEGKFEVKEILDGFKDDTEKFVESYFGRGESPEIRVIDYDGVLEEMRTILNKIAKV